MFNGKRKKISKFIKGEKREIKELASGKEGFGTFLKDSAKLLKDLFIPHENNNHQPKLLRPKTLLFYIIVAITIKLVVTGFLFFTYPSPAKLAAIVSNRMVDLINQSREENDTSPLVVNGFLVDAALDKANDMMDKQYFSHTSPEGLKPWQWIDKDNYDYVYAGENLAMDFREAEVVHSAFMKSPSHRKNILNPKYRELGIGVLHGEMNGRSTILLVEMFGTRRQERALVLTTKAPVREMKVEPPPKAEQTDAVLGQEVVEQKTPEPSSEDSASLSAEESSAPVETPEELFVPTGGIINVEVDQKASTTIAGSIVEYSNIFFIAFLVFILLALALNIFVKIKVQNYSVIMQTLVVVALVSAFVLVKFHYIEEVSEQLLIL